MSPELNERQSREPRSRVRRRVVTWSCLTLGCGLLFVALLTGVAFSQLRSMAPQSRELDLPSSASRAEASPEVELATPIELHLDLSTVQWILLPLPAGENFSIEASFDPEHYSLVQRDLSRPDSPDSPGPKILEVRFAPLTPTLAFLRMKLGEELPRLEIRVPRDQPLVLKGVMKSSFAAIEAGGLTLDALDLEVDGGAATVSFLEPTSRPMKSLVLVGDKGSVEVTGLGNGSPASVRVAQRLGEIDLDFRGPWLTDSRIDLQVEYAGGSLWLPRDVVTRGVGEEARSVIVEPREGNSRVPELSIDLTESMGRLVIVQ